MNRFIVETDSAAKAKLFLSLMKELKFVKSVIPENKQYDWTNPSRPATDDEFEQMCREMDAEEEAGLGMSTEDAKRKTMNKIKEWKRKNLR